MGTSATTGEAETSVQAIYFPRRRATPVWLLKRWRRSAPGVAESDVARSIGEFVDLEVPPSPAMNPVSEGERQRTSGSDQRPGSVRDFLTS